MIRPFLLSLALMCVGVASLLAQDVVVTAEDTQSFEPSGDPLHAEYEDLDVASKNAVYAIRECLDFQYGAHGRYFDCVDLPLLRCERGRERAFGADTCAEHALRTWTWMIHAIQRGMSNGVEDAHLSEPWNDWADAQCDVTYAVSLPWTDDPEDQKVQCKAELAALQAIRMWTSRAP